MAANETEGRLFIAAPLPVKMARILARSAQMLERHLPGRYVPMENYHVTLAFIGNAPLALATQLKGAFADMAKEFAPVKVQLSQLGYFGSAKNAILWAGLTNGEKLLPLAQRVRSTLRDLNIPFDTKAVKPHITIARKVHLQNASLPSLPHSEEEMNTLVLYHSTRRQGTLVYLPILSVQLGG